MNDLTSRFLKTNDLSVKEAKAFFDANFDNTSCAVIFSDLKNSSSPEDTRALLWLLINICRSEKYIGTVEHQLELYKGLPSEFFKNDDAKIRKNISLLLGKVRSAGNLELLKDAFENENTLFVLEGIVSSLLNYADTEPEITGYLKHGLSRLSEEDNVHIRKITDKISKATAPKEKREPRLLSRSIKGKYTLLLTCPNPKITAKELKDRSISSSVYDEGDYLVKADNIKDLSTLNEFRTYYEYMIVADTISDRADIRNKIDPDKLFDICSDIFGNSHTNYYYYTDVKGYSIDNGKRMEIQKKVISSLMGTRFINDVSAYDLEIRIVHSKKNYLVCIVPGKHNDTRFTYRTESISASMHPAVAGAICYALRPYFRKDHLVIDPFCGAGTLILERSRYPHKDIHCSDISKQALEALRTNMKNLKSRFKVFTHDATKPFEDRYDEIFANLPFGLRVSSHNANLYLYRDFIANLKNMLSKNRHAFIFTNDKKLFSTLLDDELKVEGTIRFSAGGLYPTLFILTNAF